MGALGLGEGLGGVRRLVRRRLVRRRLVRRRLVGGGSSGGGSGGSSGGGTDLGTGGDPSVNSERSERYLKCLSDAKRPADIEKCSAILEK